MKQRLMDFPNQFLQVLGGQLYCGACCTNVGSCKSDARQYCNTMQHTRNVQKKIAGTQRGVQLLKCITDYKGVITSQADGQEPDGFALVPETVQVIRAEFLQEMLRADKVWSGP